MYTGPRSRGKSSVSRSPRGPPYGASAAVPTTAAVVPVVVVVIAVVGVRPLRVRRARFLRRLLLSRLRLNARRRRGRRRRRRTRRDVRDPIAEVLRHRVTHTLRQLDHRTDECREILPLRVRPDDVAELINALVRLPVRLRVLLENRRSPAGQRLRVRADEVGHRGIARRLRGCRIVGHDERVRLGQQPRHLGLLGIGRDTARHEVGRVDGLESLLHRDRCRAQHDDLGRGGGLLGRLDRRAPHGRERGNSRRDDDEHERDGRDRHEPAGPLRDRRGPHTGQRPPEQDARVRRPRPVGCLVGP
ncbi:hypothetical protein HNR16_000563 [Pseudoclavibacter chungangensis]|nr:hypothetical protein [Pseudoclavibacter chungangensis]